MESQHLERRPALAAHLGRRVRVHGIACRGGMYWDGSLVVRRTLVLDVRMGDERIAHHSWVQGSDLIRAGLLHPGDAFAASCLVHRYDAVDPMAGCRITRYGLSDPKDIVGFGPANLAIMVAELVRAFGWEAVAGAVEQVHAEEGA